MVQRIIFTKHFCTLYPAWTVQVVMFVFVYAEAKLRKLRKWGFRKDNDWRVVVVRKGNKQICGNKHQKAHKTFKKLCLSRWREIPCYGGAIPSKSLDGETIKKFRWFALTWPSGHYQMTLCWGETAAVQLFRVLMTLWFGFLLCRFHICVPSEFLVFLRRWCL